MSETLFPDLAPLVLPEAEPVEKLSADRRRTLRQRGDVARGRHPLTGSRLAADPEAKCGNCRFRDLIDWHNRTYPKCFFEPANWDVEKMHGWPRVTHSTASDVRAWWPGCTDHEWGDPKLSPGRSTVPTMTRPRPGDRYRLPIVTTSDGHLQRDSIVTVNKVDRLGCTCLRLHTTRPGPADGPLGTLMHLVVQRCPWHRANPPDGTEEPVRVEEVAG